MDRTSFFKSILITVVAYKKDAQEIISQLESFLSEGISVVIYDNSPTSAFINRNNNFSIHYKHDPDNSGLSVAYNYSIQEASRLGKSWLLILDQDTKCTIRYVEKLLDSLEKHSASLAFVPRLHDGLGIVSPFRFSFAKGKRIKSIEVDKLPLSKFRFANSGLLINCDASQQAGGYDETIPLDFSDIAFAERLLKITNHFIVVDIELDHSFSGSSHVSKEQALIRFNYFCIGALRMGANYGNYVQFFLQAFVRSILLGFRYSSVNFTKNFFQHVLHD